MDNRLTKKGAAKGLAAVLLIALGYLAFVDVRGSRENNRHINPSIFAAFRQIEDGCMNETWPNRTVRCAQVLETAKACHDNPSEGCVSAEDYYQMLQNLGFDLPPFYEPGYTPKKVFP